MNLEILSFVRPAIRIEYKRTYEHNIDYAENAITTDLESVYLF